MGKDAVLFAEHVLNVTSAMCNEHVATLNKRARKRINDQIGDFSTLNFLYELREIPELLKKIKLQAFLLRNLPEASRKTVIKDGKKNGVNKDSFIIRPIDYYFGVAPLLADLRSALTAYNSQTSSINEKMKRFRSIRFGSKKVGTIDHVIVDDLYNPSKYDEQYIVSTSMSGFISMDVPYFAQIAPQAFALLDDIQVDISASNAYNAIPWTWFLDKFLPVGDWLETMPSLMKPRCTFNGTFSHKITAFSKYISIKHDYLVTASGFDLGDASNKTYIRTPVNGSLSSTFKWTPPGGIDSPDEFAVMRDIMFPTKR